jgi:hypothetical protein
MERPLTIRDHSAPDIIVFDIVEYIVIATYLLPVESFWENWSDIDSYERLDDVVAFYSFNSRKPVIIMVILMVEPVI